MTRFQILASCLTFAFSISTSAQGGDWQPVTGAEKLREFMSGTTAERMMPNGEISRGEYRADGTGTLYSWGASIPRAWSVKGDDQVCVTAVLVTRCYRFERNTADPDLYRAYDTGTGVTAEFRVIDGRAVATGSPEDIGGEGSAATPSAGEMAAELSNPNTSVASLTFKNQFRWFDGNLPDAGNQSSYTLLFQPSLPFVLDGGDKILWRPAVPILVDQPMFDTGANSFKEASGLGDIAFDLAYAPKTEGGLVLAYGFIMSLPTATDDLGTDKWTLGPELLVGKATPKYFAGIFPSHQWDIAGSGNKDISLTTIQPIFTYLPGGGWSVGTVPIITYDWVADQWTVPLQLTVGKAVVISGRPWKFAVELNYYVEKPDAFGPEWMFSVNITPVVKNGLASWFGLGDN